MGYYCQLRDTNKPVHLHPDTPPNALNEFTNAGFDFERIYWDNVGYEIYTIHGKWTRVQEVLFDYGSWIEDDTIMHFVGEDGEMWKIHLSNGHMDEYEGWVAYADTSVTHVTLTPRAEPARL